MISNYRLGKQKSALGSVMVASLLAGCGGQQQKPQTLGDIDVSTRHKKSGENSEPQRSKEDIKNAYYEYLEDAEEDDEFRLLAATRVAELELEAGGAGSIDDDVAGSEQQYEVAVHNTIRLLEQALEDFPNKPGNDHTMYQLAKAYGQVGQPEKADQVLRELVSRYPDTPYYTEAKFRIAEHAFIYQDYDAAQRAYTEVLAAPNNQNFVEKSLFKRGWAYFKQQSYDEALADYYRALDQHGFASYEQLSGSEKELFDEYFRAVGLAFAYLGGAVAIDEFYSQHSNTPYPFRTYSVVSELLLEQERYSDSVNTLQAYINRFPNGSGVLQAHIKMVSIWKEADFFNNYVAAFETLYNRYNSNAAVWRTGNIPEAEQKRATAIIRDNIVLLASYYHNRYNKTSSQPDFDQANLWYERYLANYAPYARQDKINQLYAELLNKAGRDERALTFYERAAFDGDIVLDKEAAYATIYLSDRLYQKAMPERKPELLEKHLSYAFSYGQLYPEDKRSPEVIQHAVELAFKDRQLARTIEIANLMPDDAPQAPRREVNLLKAQAYFDQGQYEDAEIMYQDLLVAQNLTPEQRQDLSNKLALSLYKQAEAAPPETDPAMMAAGYLRVQQLVPQSELAPTAVYDAIAVFMTHEMWNEAIEYLNFYQREYPGHRYQNEVGKKLSVAYLNAGKSVEAAREFEKLSGFVESQEEKMAALWQAAELYKSKDELNSALRTYKEYAHTYKQPYDTNMEAMQNIADIYQKQGEADKRVFWLNKIIAADTKAPASVKTDRTQYIAANATMAMALMQLNEFDRLRLVHPLAQSLKRKKTAMQESVKLFGQASAYGYEDMVTQATWQIGHIYREFAKALLASERPRNLNDEELEQYNILLEDQAFPFEDKAIEFYETNVSRIATGTYDNWVQKSLTELGELFPARYARAGKVETFVEQLP